ncbi:uncharacterized protein LOC131853452 [Achroia grisella]|uniref:uncharacterized protein LOC131853452 n=1 Tax=Achroia grisella TaxID=688607 RepID=UPI0027D317E0|nr:uncharacterized protein LOC131853452 [Achroia grisella]
MPKAKTDAVHRFYHYDPIENKSKCLICGNKIKGKHTSNLKNHVSIKHTKEYKITVDLNKNAVVSQGKMTLEKYERLKMQCLKLVTVHGQPFSILEDKAFLNIMHMAVPASVNKVNIELIKDMICDKASDIKSKISNETKNRMICLKLDFLTYLDRNFIGVNIQYVIEGTVIERNLAVIIVANKQTCDFLREKLLATLNYFTIDISQIYSITTDNGNNYKKTFKLLNSKFYNTLLEEKTDYLREYINENESDSDEEDESQQISENDIVRNVNMFVDHIHSPFKPRLMTCAAHMLHFSVTDALNKNIKTQIVIELARKVVHILRQPTFKNIFLESNLRKPVVDCAARWTSTYNMLVSLFSLRTLCRNNTDISAVLSTDFWQQISLIIDSLKPVNDAIMNLQKKQLTIGDFFIVWLTCKSRVEVIPASLAKDLLDAMNARENILRKSDLVLENLYLDGRLNVILSDEECIKAQSLLLETYNHLQNILQTEAADIVFADIQIKEENYNNCQASTRTENENPIIATSDIERILINTEKERNSARAASSLEVMLKDLRYAPRLPLNENILLYWRNKKTTQLTISGVANTVLATPATQVSVEQLLSSLKFILSPLRSKIEGNLLQNILLLKLNPDLVE